MFHKPEHKVKINKWDYKHQARRDRYFQ